MPEVSDRFIMMGIEINCERLKRYAEMFHPDTTFDDLEPQEKMIVLPRLREFDGVLANAGALGVVALMRGDQELEALLQQMVGKTLTQLRREFCAKSPLHVERSSHHGH